VLGVLDGEFLVEVGAGALKQDRSQDTTKKLAIPTIY
jgi:hypothetical protein